jgi:hypothetical protein
VETVCEAQSEHHMSDGEAPAHPRLAQSAARLYLARLEAAASRVQSDSARRALCELASTTASALRQGSQLTMAEVKFNFSSLAGVAREDQRLFIDEFQLGLGYDGAPIVVMGTETAGDPKEQETLVWDCLLTALILSNSPQSVVEALLRQSGWWIDLESRGLPPDPWRPFHVHPNDLYQVQRDRGRQTWKVIAGLVAPDPAPAEAVLRQGAEPGLGDLTYQIERSGLPALRAAGGAKPSPARTEWLEQEVIPALRQTASVLIVHGYGRNSRDWIPADKRLFEAFLGRPVEIEGETVAGKWLWHDSADGRLVIYCHALSGAISRAYLDEVRQLVQEHLSAI